MPSGAQRPDSSRDREREPCPHRILDDCGGAFAMGAIGGSVVHAVKGLYNSPHGARLTGAAQAVRMNGPRIGGSFAVWGGVFSSCDCTLVYMRGKEDPWNSIMAGAGTGGFLAMRQGLKSIARSAAFGACILALIEGAGIMVNKMVTPSAQDQMVTQEQPENWFTGLFGGGEGKEKSGSSSQGKTEVLESFDLNSPTPVPSFDYK